MKLTLRRIGNSLGVIIPKPALDSWRVGEGDALYLTPAGITPAPAGSSAHERLDDLKRRLALAVAGSFTPRQIRAHSLANLHRWKRTGAWVPAYGEWEAILRDPDDGALFAAMLGRDERSTQLRQSAPYVGLLPRDEVRRINEEAAG